MKSIPRALFATSLLGCVTAYAKNEPTADPGAAEVTGNSSSATGLLLGKFTGESAYDKAWSAFTLYKDETNPILQEFSLQGRLQVQYADGQSKNGHFDIQDYKNGGKDEAVWGDRFEARRAYFGIKSKWFQNWKFEGQIDVDTDGMNGKGERTLYKDIYDLYITYAASDALNVSVGKQEVKFSREQEISAKEILTFERSVVSDLTFPGNLTGIWASGKGIQEHWLYDLGVYGNDRVREFTNFEGGTIILGKIGYDYSSAAGFDSAVASFRYMHNTDPGYVSNEVDANFKPPTSPKFTDTVGLSTDIIQGRFGLTADLIYGCGDDNTKQSDVLALNVIPSYFIADGVQLIGRVQLATSDDNNGTSGIPAGGRYESSAPTKDTLGAKRTGDSYASVYAGVNYYLYGHKLKLMNGVEYSHLGGGDYDGTTLLSGLRFSF